jgi:hypothetical protein
VLSLGKSIESRPIELHVFGDAASPALIIGGIHGSEPTSAFVAERPGEQAWTRNRGALLAALAFEAGDG